MSLRSMVEIRIVPAGRTKHAKYSLIDLDWLGAIQQSSIDGYTQLLVQGVWILVPFDIGMTRCILAGERDKDGYIKPPEPF